MNLSVNDDKELDKKIEEAWLLFKLKEYKSAGKIVFPLLEKYPANKQLIEIGVSPFIQENNTGQIDLMLARINNVDFPDKKKITRELRLASSLNRCDYKESANIYSSLIKDYPEKIEYKRGYAETLLKLKLWPMAKKAYKDIYSIKDVKDKFLKQDYHRAVEEGSNGLITDFLYTHAPESLREYIVKHGVLVWLNKRLRCTFTTIMEFYSKRALGNSSKVEEIIPGHNVTVDYFFNEIFDFSIGWKTYYFNENSYHTPYAGVQADIENFHSKTSFSYDELVRNPIEGINKEARMDNFSSENEILFFDRLTFGYLFESSFYRVNSEKNDINGEGYLGYKIKNMPFTSLAVWQDPYVSLNFSYLDAHWDKSFVRANEVLDFLEDEKIFSGGIYIEKAFTHFFSCRATFARMYDWRRDFYSTLTGAGTSFWFRDYLKLDVDYEYLLNAQGTLGTGDVQTIRGKLKILF
ncbi:hypothetical protein OMAG_002388 [Candidatus Omnitrophus magneticus]|uniref:TPR repeat-containing protein n=1 Tax=Candidatus Omnitrophus magneticus TaxID=1609969 RepID=A0A0F0CP05_9BACT|nr:hypothetical protein OMAG_002388 [Candidatus Omnitrophus magneticus]